MSDKLDVEKSVLSAAYKSPERAQNKVTRNSHDPINLGVGESLFVAHKRRLHRKLGGPKSGQNGP